MSQTDVPPIPDQNLSFCHAESRVLLKYCSRKHCTYLALASSWHSHSLAGRQFLQTHTCIPIHMVVPIIDTHTAPHLQALHQLHPQLWVPYTYACSHYLHGHSPTWRPRFPARGTPALELTAPPGSVPTAPSSWHTPGSGSRSLGVAHGLHRSVCACVVWGVVCGTTSTIDHDITEGVV